jgi:hypothetical protein
MPRRGFQGTSVMRRAWITGRAARLRRGGRRTARPRTVFVVGDGSECSGDASKVVELSRLPVRVDPDSLNYTYDGNKERNHPGVSHAGTVPR